jgi:hypothetical protein
VLQKYTFFIKQPKKNNNSLGFSTPFVYLCILKSIAASNSNPNNDANGDGRVDSGDVLLILHSNQ